MTERSRNTEQISSWETTWTDWQRHIITDTGCESETQRTREHLLPCAAPHTKTVRHKRLPTKTQSTKDLKKKKEHTRSRGSERETHSHTCMPVAGEGGRRAQHRSAAPEERQGGGVAAELQHTPG